VHDVSAGGVGVALAEMAIRAGVGARIDAIGGHGELFSEAPSRFVVATHRPSEVVDRAASLGVRASVLGRAGGPSLVVAGLLEVAVDRLRSRWSDAIPDALAEPA
jgi:phosphoribosylformylglycinamidine synthase